MRTGYGGDHAARAAATLEAGARRLADTPHLTVAYALLADADARTRARQGRLDRVRAAAISAAAAEVVDGQWHDEFVVDVRAVGRIGPTVAEVLAGRASDLIPTGTAVADHDVLAGVGPDGYGLALRVAVVLGACDLLDDVRSLRRGLRRRAGLIGGTTECSDDPIALSLLYRLDDYAAGLGRHEQALEEALLAEPWPSVRTDGGPRDEGRLLTEELARVTGLAVSGPADGPDREVLRLSRALKALAVRMAQLWSGLEVLTGRDHPSTRERAELVNRTALDVIGAGLRDELAGAEPPSTRRDAALGLSVLASLVSLSATATMVTRWCDAVEPPSADLAA